MLDKRWTVKQMDEAAFLALQDGLGNVNPAVRRLLACRGITSFEHAKDFFRPSLESLHDPFLMLGMEQAVNRITDALEWHERILVYGDYDVDGTTSVAVVYSFLREQYPNGDISYYIPHRYREGYGVSKAGIDYAHANGYTLMITLDCGIKSNVLVADAAKLGIDVIICDHHLPDEDLPPAFAILNPKQPLCNYPYKELSGCGIGLKLVQGIAQKLKLPTESWEKYLDLVATSIAADIVPIDGENRILAYYGIKRVNEQPCLAIKTLKESAGVQKILTVSDLVFVIGPRVNAAGRMDDARKAVDLFIEKEEERSKELAEILHLDNSDRKEVDKSITAEALAMLQNDVKQHTKKSTVLYQPHWHKGVVGIVASRLIDHFYRPTIVLTGGDGKVSGSARSVPGFNIYEAIHECSELLENYGGHFFAAGMTMLPENVQPFIEKFETIVAGRIKPEMLIPEILIDAEINFEDVTQTFFNILRQFEPYGPTNLRPVFVTRRAYDYRGYSKVVKEQHLRIVLHQHRNLTVEGIGFGLSDKYDMLQNGPVDIVYTVDENEFNGNTKLQLRLIDMRPSH